MVLENINVDDIKHKLLTQLDINIEKGERFASHLLKQNTSNDDISTLKESLEQDGYNVEVVDMGDQIRVSIYTD